MCLVVLALAFGLIAPSAAEPAFRQGQPVQPVIDVTTLGDAGITSTIAKARPSVAAMFQRRRFEGVVTDAQAPAARVVRDLLAAFVRCDDSFRLIVTPDLRERIQRRESFVRVTFPSSLRVQVGSGAKPTPIGSLLVPLSGQWTRSGQTFFYEDADSHDWSALRWSAPDAAVWNALLDSLAKLRV